MANSKNISQIEMKQQMTKKQNMYCKMLLKIYIKENHSSYSVAKFNAHFMLNNHKCHPYN